MLSHWTVYLIVKLDSLVSVFGTTAGILGAFTGACLLVGFMDGPGWPKLITRFLKWSIPLCFVFSVLWALTPNTKEAAAIYLIPKVVNNESVQNISSNTLKLLEEYTAELLRDMRDKGKEQIDKSTQSEKK